MAALGYIQMAMMTGAIAGLLAQWGLIRMFRDGAEAPAALGRRPGRRSAT